MGKWRNRKVAFGNCSKAPSKFKSMIINEINKRDTRGIIRNVKVERISKDNSLEISLDFYSDEKIEAEIAEYVKVIITSSTKEAMGNYNKSIN